MKGARTKESVAPISLLMAISFRLTSMPVLTVLAIRITETISRTVMIATQA